MKIEEYIWAMTHEDFLEFLAGLVHALADGHLYFLKKVIEVEEEHRAKLKEHASPDGDPAAAP